MREGPYYLSPLFSESEFLKQAIAYGGFDSDLENLVTQAIYHPNETHLFRPPQNLGSTGFGTDAAGFVVEGLAKGALGWLGGQGIGWAAEAAGLFTPGATKADIAQMQAKLEDLQSSVDALSNQLAQSTAQILAAIDYSQYNLIAVQQLKLAAQVDVVEQDVTVLADGCPAVTTSPTPPWSKFCKSQKALVAKELSESEIHASFEEFAAALEDTATVGNKGLLHLFSLCTGESVGHFFRYGDSVKIQDMWDYWYAVEVQGANLKVELWHLQDAQDNSAGKNELLGFLGDASQTPPTDGILQNTKKAEASLVFPIIPQGEVVNTEDHFTWMTTYPGTTSTPACKLGLSSPPNGQGGASTGPQLGFGGKGYPVIPYPGDPETTWFSPTASQLSSLIHGATYSPGEWISAETSTKPGDPPGVTSIPFAPGMDAITNPGCTPNGPWVWTSTLVDPKVAGNYVVTNLNSGATQPTNSSVGKTGNFNWELLVGQFANQYYWYH